MQVAQAGRRAQAVGKGGPSVGKWLPLVSAGERALCACAGRGARRGAGCRQGKAQPQCGRTGRTALKIV